MRRNKLCERGLETRTHGKCARFHSGVGTHIKMKKFRRPAPQSAYPHCTKHSKEIADLTVNVSVDNEGEALTIFWEKTRLWDDQSYLSILFGRIFRRFRFPSISLSLRPPSAESANSCHPVRAFGTKPVLRQTS